MSAPQLRTERLSTNLIHVPKRMRSHVDAERVSALADSMDQIGLMTPITIFNDNHTEADGEVFYGPILIAGAHRLLAAQKLGWVFIECVVSTADEFDRRLWEIAENLHRSELTAQERAAHVAEWVRLSEEKRGQVAQVSGGRGKEGGISAASRELRMERTEVRRAVKIDSITPAAKEAAKAAKIDGNQSALLKVAAAPPEKQVQEVQRIAEQRSQPAGTQYENLVRFLERLGNLDADKLEFPPFGDVGPQELLDTIRAAEATLRKLRLRVEALP